METVITWNLCTSLRGTECDVLSDGGESELIGSRCWCVQLIYIHTCMWAFLCSPGWAVHHSATSYNWTRRLHLNPDLTTYGALVMHCHQPQHGTRFLQSQQGSRFSIHSLLHSFPFYIVLFLLYIRLFAHILVSKNSSRINTCMYCSHHRSSTWMWSMAVTYQDRVDMWEMENCDYSSIIVILFHSLL